MNTTRRTFLRSLAAMIPVAWMPPVPTRIDSLVEGRDYFVGGNVDCDVSHISNDKWINCPAGEWKVVHIEC